MEFFLFLFFKLGASGKGRQNVEEGNLFCISTGHSGFQFKKDNFNLILRYFAQ